jgi:hypothetical protein
MTTALAAVAFCLLPVQELPDGKTVRERLERILASPDYDTGESNAKRGSILDWILRKLAEAFGLLRSLGERAPAVVWTVLAVCFAILALIFLHGAVILLRALRASRPGGALRDAGPAAGPGDPRELLERARAAAREGRREEALRLTHRAALLGLDRRGVLRFQESLTNGDYRRQLRARPRDGETFDALVRLHEPACFGRRPVADGDVENGLRLASELLEGGIA